jgi:hypothetical protein
MTSKNKLMFYCDLFVFFILLVLTLCITEIVKTFLYTLCLILIIVIISIIRILQYLYNFCMTVVT